MLLMLTCYKGQVILLPPPPVSIPQSRKIIHGMRPVGHKE